MFGVYHRIDRKVIYNVNLNSVKNYEVVIIKKEHVTHFIIFVRPTNMLLHKNTRLKKAM